MHVNSPLRQAQVYSEMNGFFHVPEGIPALAKGCIGCGTKH